MLDAGFADQVEANPHTLAVGRQTLIIVVTFPKSAGSIGASELQVNYWDAGVALGAAALDAGEGSVNGRG